MVPGVLLQAPQLRPLRGERYVRLGEACRGSVNASSNVREFRQQVKFIYGAAPQFQIEMEPQNCIIGVRSKRLQRSLQRIYKGFTNQLTEVI